MKVQDKFYLNHFKDLLIYTFTSLGYGLVITNSIEVNNLVKLKFINSIPCKVTKIFQIQINENKNNDEIKQ